MKENAFLTIASLLSILFTTFHLTDDIVRGMSPGGLVNLAVVLVLVVWLYATLVLAERRSVRVGFCTSAADRLQSRRRWDPAFVGDRDGKRSSPAESGLRQGAIRNFRTGT
jgi:hypothetical protein